jgi:hypothetical protein
MSCAEADRLMRVVGTKTLDLARQIDCTPLEAAQIQTKAAETLAKLIYGQPVKKRES